MTTTLYGIPKCSTCVKAQSWLRKSGVAFEFIDYRQHRVPAATLKAWAAQVGWGALINRASTSWRELPPPRRNPASDPEFTLLVKEYPTLVKRPVLEHEGRITLGFTDKLYRSVFGS